MLLHIIHVDERECCLCNEVETKMHVFLYCPLYDDYRNTLSMKAESVNGDFINLNDNDKLRVLFTHPELIRICAQTCFDILNRRSSFLCK